MLETIKRLLSHQNFGHIYKLKEGIIIHKQLTLKIFIQVILKIHIISWSF